MQKIYLASSSPRRKELLGQLGLKFKVCSSDYKENMSLKMRPTKLAEYLSKGKAESALENIKSGLIISADTFITFDNKVLGKPHTKVQAKKTLKDISNKTLKVITGFTILDVETKKSISRSVVTKVFIKKLKESEIDNYIKTGEPLDKAGAFGIQGLGVLLVKKIEGDYNNVVGLPLFELGQALAQFGVNII